MTFIDAFMLSHKFTDTKMHDNHDNSIEHQFFSDEAVWHNILFAQNVGTKFV